MDFTRSKSQDQDVHHLRLDLELLSALVLDILMLVMVLMTDDKINDRAHDLAIFVLL